MCVVHVPCSWLPLPWTDADDTSHDTRHPSWWCEHHPQTDSHTSTPSYQAPQPSWSSPVLTTLRHHQHRHHHHCLSTCRCTSNSVKLTCLCADAPVTVISSYHSRPVSHTFYGCLIGQAFIFCRCGFFLMPALCNRGAIIFLPCSFFLLLSFFYLLLFFPRLISAAVDRMSAILLHMAWP